MNELEFRNTLINIMCSPIYGVSFCNRCPVHWCASSYVSTKDLRTAARLAYKYRYPRATSADKKLLNRWAAIARKYPKGGAKIV